MQNAALVLDAMGCDGEPLIYTSNFYRANASASVLVGACGCMRVGARLAGARALGRACTPLTLPVLVRRGRHRRLL